MLASLIVMAGPAFGGGGVSFPDDPAIGTLPAMSEVVLEFQVVVEDPLATPAGTVCNQATVSGTGFGDVASDDPSTMAEGDATCTVLTPYDLGDAPDPTFPTLVASSGARHAISPGMRLGACLDAEGDGQPTAAADGDDAAAGFFTDGTCAVGGDDEDGVTWTTLLVPGVAATVDVEASMTGVLDAWVDWNADGDWSDAGERIFDGEALAVGTNGLGLAVPTGASAGSLVQSRFRYSSAGVGSFDGEAADGEVEDHRVQIENPSIAVTKTALPISVPEPGGPVTFTVRVTNDGSVPVDLATLLDDVYGDLHGQGTCVLPQNGIASGDFYECAFSATASCGDAGGTETDTVTAMGTAGGAAVTGTDTATVTCTDTPPTLSVAKVADPSNLVEPAGAVEYTVTVENTSASTDPVTLQSLVDELAGDLNGQGTCVTGGVILPGSANAFTCSFTATVSCNAGEDVVHTVTASGEDDETTGTGDAVAQATVSCTDSVPSIVVTKSADPATVVEPGGPVEYTVEIDNTSVSSDPVTIATMTDDEVGGSLDGVGDCTLPQVIAPGETYSCAYVQNVAGTAGDMVTNTVDVAGEDDDGTAVAGQAMATVELLTADDVPPEAVASIRGTEIEEPCHPFHFLTIGSVDLAFDEPMANQDDAAHYRLVTTGPDGLFGTTSCLGGGDDLTVPFTVSSPDGTSASLRFGGEDGLYRVVACETLADEAGNFLDGDGDGTEGPSLVRTFRVDVTNLFANGHLDCELAPWGALPPASPDVLRDPADADDSGESGSVLLDGVETSGLGVEQCVALDPESPFQAPPFELSYRARLDAGPGEEVGVGGVCQFFDAAACGGGNVGAHALPQQVLFDTAGTWILLTGEVVVPSATRSALCSLHALSLDPAAPLVRLDRIVLDASGRIFEDGFESGEISAWSTP